MHKSGNNAAKAFAPALTTLWIVLTLVELAAGLLFLSKAVADKARSHSPPVINKDDIAYYQMERRTPSVDPAAAARRMTY